MEINEYVDKCWEACEEYICGVRNGSILTNQWIKKSVERYIKDLKRDELEYRVDKAEQVFKFFYFIKINNNNIYKQYKLLPFQAFIIASLFGFYYKGTNKRKYRTAYLFMARKNGKSVFSAALQLYFLVADGVEDPQSLLVASTREQASICLEYATGIINHSPALAKRLEALRFKIQFKDRKKGGFSKVLASNANKLDGYSASGAILDEVHAYPDDKLFNVIKSSVLARENPMIFLITTAGFSLTSFCYNYTMYAKNVLNGNVQDDSLFAMLYTLDDTDKHEDPKNWAKSNPALGHIGHLDDLIIEYNQSRYSITQLNNFLTKHLNVFVDQEEAWLPNDVLNKAFETDFKVEDLYGCEAYIGLDLSATRDLTALVVLVKKDNIFYAIPYFFMVNESEKFLRNAGVSLKNWINEGYIRLSDKRTVDYDDVISVFEDINSKFNIRMCSYDPHNSASILNKIYEIGIPAEPFVQKAQLFNEPLKAIERYLFDETLKMKNPVLKWNLNNAVPYRDSNANIKLMKNMSLDSIDGAVALGMAMGSYLNMNISNNIVADIWNK